MSWDALVQLLATVGDDRVATELKQIATILLYTGIRPQELKGLTWSDVDLEKRCMSVESKSGKQRKVPFGHKVHQILVERAEAGTGSQYVLGKSPSAALHRISRRLRDLPCTADGHKLTLYCLRLSFAARWTTLGGSLEGLKAMMGFSSSLPIEPVLSHDQQYAIATRFQSQPENKELN